LLPNEGSPRLPALDGLRGIAILLVLVWHYFVGLLHTEPEPGSTAAYALACLRLAWSGVDLFFVLSGFLIGGILLDNRHSANYFQVFYVRRVCRIFPLYFLVLFVFLVQIAPTTTTTLCWLVTLLSYATFTQNFTMAFHNNFGSWMEVTWSLAIEEQFYLILPFVILYCDPRKLPWFLIGAVVATPLLRLALNYWYGAHDGVGFLAVYVLTPCRMDALLLGVICAWILRQQKLRQFLLIERARVILYAALATLLMGAACPSWSSFGMSTFGYSWMALLYFCFLLIVVTQKSGLLHSIASNGLLQRLGLIAYGVYLLHQGILELTHGLFLHHAPTIANLVDALVTLLALLLTLSLAAVSYKWFEKPIVAMGHALKYQGSATLPHAAWWYLPKHRQAI
jgi:peptidoglycan/LPS O-acetylase OafA/YrhL